MYIANGMSTGLNLHAPAGICIYNGDVYEERKIMMPEKIPTVSDLFIISDESGNNMNFFASASKTNRKDFENLKQKDVEKSFLDGAKNALEDAKVISYETDNYDGYPGIKMIVTSKMAGVDIEQTIIMINAVDLNDVGYSYTITYTDVSGGTLRDAIEESISTINFVNVSNLASQYSTPEELAEYQATKTNRNINNTPAVTTKNIPAPTVTAVEKDASFKDFLEEAGVVDEEYNEIMDMLENKDENTRTTLSKEEMRKKYLGE